MNASDDIHKLTVKVEQLLAMLELFEKQGDRKAALFADGMRYRLARLRMADASHDRIRLSNALLDIVPNGRDLDAIGFSIDLYPDIVALSADISVSAAELA